MKSKKNRDAALDYQERRERTLMERMESTGGTIARAEDGSSPGTGQHGKSKSLTYGGEMATEKKTGKEARIVYGEGKEGECMWTGLKEDRKGELTDEVNRRKNPQKGKERPKTPRSKGGLRKTTTGGKRVGNRWLGRYPQSLKKG